jgi:uncharacterized protein DUF1259
MDAKKLRPLVTSTASAVVLICLLMPWLAAQNAPSVPAEWKEVEDAMGRPGQMQGADVLKFSMPRKDLSVTANGVAIKPGFALGSWAAFKRAGNEAMVMGDLVLTEEEVNPVISRLQAGGVSEAALHNHLLRESPRVMYLHIASHGDAVKMARTIHDALALTKTPPASKQPAAPASFELDEKQIEQAIGRSGKVNGGILQFSVPRSEKITDNDMDIPPSMGVATGINFQPAGKGRAAITGDFVLIASEVNPVIKALRDGGVQVTALHSHMLTEQPRLFFMHFWGVDDPGKLAHTLRTALDQMNNAKP